MVFYHIGLVGNKEKNRKAQRTEGRKQRRLKGKKEEKKEG